MSVYPANFVDPEPICSEQQSVQQSFFCGLQPRGRDPRADPPALAARKSSAPAALLPCAGRALTGTRFRIRAHRPLLAIHTPNARRPCTRTSTRRLLMHRAARATPLPSAPKHGPSADQSRPRSVSETASSAGVMLRNSRVFCSSPRRDSWVSTIRGSGRNWRTSHMNWL